MCFICNPENLQLTSTPTAPDRDRWCHWQSAGFWWPIWWMVFGGGSMFQLPKRLNCKMTFLSTSHCFCSRENPTISLMNRFWDKVNMGPTKTLQSCAQDLSEDQIISMKAAFLRDLRTCKFHPNIRFESTFVNWWSMLGDFMLGISYDWVPLSQGRCLE